MVLSESEVVMKTTAFVQLEESRQLQNMDHQAPSAPRPKPPTLRELMERITLQLKNMYPTPIPVRNLFFPTRFFLVSRSHDVLWGRSWSILRQELGWAAYHHLCIKYYSHRWSKFLCFCTPSLANFLQSILFSTSNWTTTMSGKTTCSRSVTKIREQKVYAVLFSPLVIIRF